MTKKWDESRYRQVFLMAQKGDSISRALLLERHRKTRDKMPSYCIDYIHQLLKNIEDDLRFNGRRGSSKFFPDNPRRGADMSKKLFVKQDYEALIEEGVTSKHAISQIADKWGYTTNSNNDAASQIHRVIRDAKAFLSDSEAKTNEEVKRKLEIVTKMVSAIGYTITDYEVAEFRIRNNFANDGAIPLRLTDGIANEHERAIMYLQGMQVLRYLRDMDDNPDDRDDVVEDVQHLDIPKFLENHADKQEDRD
jgi:hypothetical protein